MKIKLMQYEEKDSEIREENPSISPEGAECDNSDKKVDDFSSGKVDKSLMEKNESTSTFDNQFPDISNVDHTEQVKTSTVEIDVKDYDSNASSSPNLVIDEKEQDKEEDEPISQDKRLSENDNVPKKSKENESIQVDLIQEQELIHPDGQNPNILSQKIKDQGKVQSDAEAIRMKIISDFQIDLEDEGSSTEPSDGSKSQEIEINQSSSSKVDNKGNY